MYTRVSVVSSSNMFESLEAWMTHGEGDWGIKLSNSSANGTCGNKYRCACACSICHLKVLLHCTDADILLTEDTRISVLVGLG